MRELECKRHLAVNDEDTYFLNNGNWVQRVLPQMVEHMLATAPAGADTNCGAIEWKRQSTCGEVYWEGYAAFTKRVSDL